ncbi:hypothetical protein BGZ96_011384 [Linnemannia gamsii]|uniref:SH3 domain-containing protein n=2 Tax=Linnemannia TaxID=2779861 RepID=A0ABQ7JT07_9FUNG|nr:hypothetical protein BGZ96_011384 [Linnemannia gamsii]
MRYSWYYHSLAIVALVALATSPAWTNTADARPLDRDLAAAIQKRQQEVHAPVAAAPAAPAPPKTPAPPGNEEPSPSKAPPPSPEITQDPPKTSERPDPPATTKNPQPTQQPPPPPPPPPPPKSANPNPPPAPKPPASHSSESSSSHNSASSSSGSARSGTASANNNDPQPTSTTTGLDDGSEVPTKVSEKVFIGLGAVGSLFLFALGGVAFCRHRKKKNLAAALLKQTAQFNHNNPYAKISEATGAAAAAAAANNNGMSGKESLPMTPTKPIGTFSVVSDYTPAMPDEIEIYYGDSVTVLQEYDDGWCMGINNSRGGIKGVVPRHCLSGGGGGYNDNNNSGYDDGGHHNGGQYGGDDGFYPPNPGFKAMANKRMSSIPAGGWNNGPPGPGPAGAGYHQNGGYGDYPPSPYNNQQGSHLGPPNQGYYGGY